LRTRKNTTHYHWEAPKYWFSFFLCYSSW